MNALKKIFLFFLIWIIYAVTRRKLSDQETASIRQKYIAMTSFAIIVALLLIVARPKKTQERALYFGKRCPACNNTMFALGKHCSECGAKV